ncbi:MAG: hypothetical protein JW709_11600 [Sedimentisphaerales bacterium]|nr:hypothetical protein [Sedimentisphaerales bacterium]
MNQESHRNDKATSGRQCRHPIRLDERCDSSGTTPAALGRGRVKEDRYGTN